MSSVWPVFDLKLELDDLLLRPVTETDLAMLVTLLPDDVELDPALPPDRPRALHQGYWRAHGGWTVDGWALSFLVLRGETPVGVQVLEATRFPLLRTVDTASWLITAARGQGVGKRMRAAVLGLAFDHLGAHAAVTSAWHDNAASLAVSRSLGYQPNGEHRQQRGDRADVMLHLRMTRPQWPDSGPVHP